MFFTTRVESAMDLSGLLALTLLVLLGLTNLSQAVVIYRLLHTPPVGHTDDQRRMVEDEPQNNHQAQLPDEHQENRQEQLPDEYQDHEQEPLPLTRIVQHAIDRAKVSEFLRTKILQADMYQPGHFDIFYQRNSPDRTFFEDYHVQRLDTAQLPGYRPLGTRRPPPPSGENVGQGRHPIKERGFNNARLADTRMQRSPSAARSQHVYIAEAESSNEQVERSKAQAKHKGRTADGRKKRKGKERRQRESEDGESGPEQ